MRRRRGVFWGEENSTHPQNDNNSICYITELRKLVCNWISTYIDISHRISRSQYHLLVAPILPQGRFSADLCCMWSSLSCPMFATIKPFLFHVCMIVNRPSGGVMLCDHQVITFWEVHRWRSRWRPVNNQSDHSFSFHSSQSELQTPSIQN